MSRDHDQDHDRRGSRALVTPHFTYSTLTLGFLGKAEESSCSTRTRY